MKLASCSPRAPCKMLSIVQHFIIPEFSYGIHFTRLNSNCLFIFTVQEFKMNENRYELSMENRSKAKCLRQICCSRAIGHSSYRTESFRLRTVAEPARLFFFSANEFFSCSSQNFLFCYISLRTNPSYNTNIGSRLVGSTFFL